ncbi:MAG: hypothetical protein SV377_07060 [Halobacteria archaeon]|nr:hypothetical protein [Halobacteria archaeon]
MNQPSQRYSELDNFLRDRVGEYLRSIVHYDEEEYEFLFFRSDVEALYSDEELAKIHEEWIIERLSKDFLENLFHIGELKGITQVFDDAVLVFLPLEEYEGIFFAYDSDADIQMPSFLDECLEKLD